MIHGGILIKTGIEEEKKVQGKFFKFVFEFTENTIHLGHDLIIIRQVLRRKQSSNFSSYLVNENNYLIYNVQIYVIYIL